MLRCALNLKLAVSVRMPSPTPIPSVMNGNIADFLDDKDNSDVGPSDPKMLEEKLIKVFVINHYLSNRIKQTSNILQDPVSATSVSYLNILKSR